MITCERWEYCIIFIVQYNAASPDNHLAYTGYPCLTESSLYITVIDRGHLLLTLIHSISTRHQLGIPYQACFWQSVYRCSMASHQHLGIVAQCFSCILPHFALVFAGGRLSDACRWGLRDVYFTGRLFLTMPRLRSCCMALVPSAWSCVLLC